MSADDSSHLAVVKALLAAGADANARDRVGDSALSTSCQNGFVQCAAALLGAGAAPGAAPGGRSPLSYAARFGSAGCIRLLRKHGADAAAQPGEWTPLHDACEAGHADCLVALLDIGAPPNAADAESTTPLHVAARRGRADCARKLLLAGAAVDARNAVRVGARWPSRGWRLRACVPPCSFVTTALPHRTPTTGPRDAPDCGGEVWTRRRCSCAAGWRRGPGGCRRGAGCPGTCHTLLCADLRFTHPATLESGDG